MNEHVIGIVVGSIRKEAFTKKIGEFLVANAPKSHRFEFIEIADLPIYNQDYDESGEPDNYSKFREKVRSMQGIIFVTPEHNRSIPAALKNALDVGSRPYGKNVWDGKPALVVSSSISGISGFGANHHLRQMLAFLNMPALQQPEVYLANVQNYFDESGQLVNDETASFLRSAINAYITFLSKFL